MMALLERPTLAEETTQKEKTNRIDENEIM